MLSRDENELLCRTNAGTPMGELFRRFWLPAMLPSEVLADGEPQRLRLLGEDLIAFRDTSGKVGVLANNCPHRGASLFFGRNEEDGLRCVYHGWKFDVTGQCVDMPNEPAESNFKTKVQAKAYPAVEYAGLIWLYMGPKDKQPPLPVYQWCAQPEADKSIARKNIQEANYAQVLEGNVDSAHVTFLHREFDRQVFGNVDSAHVTFLHREFDRQVFGIGVPYSAPQVTVAQEADFGFVYGARRPAPEGQYHWRVTTYVMPTFTQIGSPSRNGNGIFVIPRDDESCWWITVNPPPREGDAGRGRGRNNAFAELIRRQMADPTIGLIPGTWRNIRNKYNDYLIDREVQRTINYTGLPGNRAQDSAVTESMGEIYYRTSEHLGTTDAAIILMRRQLIRMARQLQRGIEPAIVRQPRLFRSVPMEVVTPEGDFARLWQPHHDQFLAEVAASR